MRGGGRSPSSPSCSRPRCGSSSPSRRGCSHFGRRARPPSWSCTPASPCSSRVASLRWRCSRPRSWAPRRSCGSHICWHSPWTCSRAPRIRPVRWRVGSRANLCGWSSGGSPAASRGSGASRVTARWADEPAPGPALAAGTRRLVAPQRRRRAAIPREPRGQRRGNRVLPRHRAAHARVVLPSYHAARGLGLLGGRGPARRVQRPLRRRRGRTPAGNRPARRGGPVGRAGSRAGETGGRAGIRLVPPARPVAAHRHRAGTRARGVRAGAAGSATHADRRSCVRRGAGSGGRGCLRRVGGAHEPRVLVRRRREHLGAVRRPVRGRALSGHGVPGRVAVRVRVPLAHRLDHNGSSRGAHGPARPGDGAGRGGVGRAGVGAGAPAVARGAAPVHERGGMRSVLMVRTLLDQLPQHIVEPLRLMRTIVLWLVEPLDWLRRLVTPGSNRVPAPPLWLRPHSGPLSGGERAAGEIAGIVTGMGLVREDDAVLDVGCGWGSMALELSRLLGPRGRYVGFDVHAPSIRWATRHLSPDRRFRFELADLRTAWSRGGASAVEYRFPMGTAAADLVLAKSIFTHLLAPDAQHYLRETRRVLRNGRAALVTVFLLGDDPGGQSIPLQEPHITFPYGGPDVWWRVKARPEAAVAYGRSH